MLGIHNPIEISSFEVTKLKLQNLEEKQQTMLASVTFSPVCFKVHFRYNFNVYNLKVAHRNCILISPCVVHYDHTFLFHLWKTQRSIFIFFLILIF